MRDVIGLGLILLGVILLLTGISVSEIPATNLLVELGGPIFILNGAIALLGGAIDLIEDKKVVRK